MTKFTKQNHLIKDANNVFVSSSSETDSASPDSAECYVNDTIYSSEDLSCTSYQLKSKIIDVHSEFHLSPKRTNLLRAFTFDGMQKVLEFGCGSGSITRFLAEQGLHVNAIEPNYHLAKAAVRRCKEFENVSIIHGDLNAYDPGVDEYDLVLCVGVTAQADQYFESASTDESLQIFLSLVRSALKPNGVCLIAAENRSGFKYSLGAHEDHTTRRYGGIHTLPGEDGICLHTRRDWLQHISRSGFECSSFLFPFPDYKLPTLLLSEDYVNNNPYAYNHLETIKSRDYFSIFEPQKYENLSWEAAVAAGTLPDLSNSFCILVSNEQAAIDQFCSLDFAHLPGYSRNMVYSTTIIKRRGEANTHRSRLMPVTLPPFDGISHAPKAEEPFFFGTLLSVEWSRSLLYQDDNFELFEQLIKQYYNYLIDLKSKDEFSLNIDLLPSNIIVTPEGWQVFDNEWATAWPVPIDLLLFRAMLMFASNYRENLINFCEKRRVNSIWDLIKWAFTLAGLPTDYHYIDSLKQQDENFQKNVGDRFTPVDLNAPLVSKSFSDRPIVSLFWKDENQEYEMSRLVSTRADTSDVLQTVSLELPSEVKLLQFIRLDPCGSFRKEAASFFRLSSLRIYGKSRFQQREKLWSLDSEKDVCKAANLVGIRYTDQEFGRGFSIIDYDAWLEFYAIPFRRLTSDERFIIEVDFRYPRTDEYLLARDRYLVGAEIFQDRQAEMDVTVNTLTEAQKELAILKNSMVWRTAKRIRDLLYEKLPMFAGKVRSRMLATIKGGTEKKATSPFGTTDEFSTEINEQNYESWLAGRPDNYWSSPTQVVEHPTISIIVPVYRVPVKIFKQTIDSVFSQTYPEWELCIADDASGEHEIVAYLKTLSDPRIKITYRSENGNISAASNSAISMAEGEYLTFLDHDDKLHENAITELILAAQLTGAEFIYSDEDFIHPDGYLCNPYFKPDFSPDLLLSHNYITHMVLVTKKLFEKVGGFRPGFEGAQDFDLFLRLSEVANQVHHIPKPLYHWRMMEGSTALQTDSKPAAHPNARKALEEALKRRNVEAEVLDGNLTHFFRVKRKIKGNPLVSIVIPFKDYPGLLKQAIESILERSTYPHFEIIGVSNDTTTPSTYSLIEELQQRDGRIRVVQCNEKFNFSRLVNYGVEQSNGKYIVLCNNDIQVISADWIESLLEHCQRSDVGVVGAKLYYPDNTIQHAGIAIGLNGAAGHMHLNFPAYHEGYYNRLQIVQNVSAVTGALMMVSKDIYYELGGFDESSFSVAYNDVDFCLKAIRNKYLNVFTPYCQAFHYESKTRGYEEETSEKRLRFEKEKALLVARYQDEMDRGDPYYNPNLNQGRDDFRYV